MAHNGLIDYGFTNLTDLEQVVSRVSQTASIPLIADIEDGFGGPLAVYRSARRLAAAGAAAMQLEDAGDMEETTSILPREKFMAKVRAAVDALKGTDCLLIARTNADPDDPEGMKEGCERLQQTLDEGAHLAMFLKVGNMRQAREVAKRVIGPKIWADIKAVKKDGRWTTPVTMDEMTPLGFVMCSTHFTLKAAMEGMLEHGLRNFVEQGNAYTFATAPATGIEGDSAMPLYDPHAYMDLERQYTKENKEYTIVGHHVEGFPQEKFKKTDIRERL